MKTLTLTLIGALGVLGAMTLTGCTTAMLKLPGGAQLLQPKDVTIKEGPKGEPGLVYKTPDGASLTVQNYTSSANVAAVQAQAGLVTGVVDAAVQAALAAVMPANPLAAVGSAAAGATTAAAAATPAITPPATNPAVLTAVESTTIVPTTPK